MNELFNDLNSTLAFIAIVVAIVVPIVIFILQRRKKSLVYEVLTNTSLLTLDEEIKGKIKILYENIPVEKVHLLILRILNDGNVPITTSDFESPLIFDLGENTQILSLEPIKTEPANLKLDFRGTRLNHITLQPLLLNSRDSIQLKLLLAQYEEKIEVDARINGVKEVKRKAITREYRFFLVLLFYLPLFISIFVVSKTLAIFGVFTSVIGAIIGFLTYINYMRRES